MIDVFLSLAADEATALHDSDSECESRSPSPSSGVESNSFKDSPMQLDVMAHDAALGPGSTPYGLSLSLFLYLVSLSSVVATVFWAVVTPIATLKCCIWMPFQTIGVYNEEPPGVIYPRLGNAGSITP